MSHERILDRFRRPAYVGENRCLPCTGVNVAIATVAAVAVTAALASADVSMAGALSAGGLVLCFGLASVYLRGYLVPGTPTLTKRYLPRWALRAFGKADEPSRNEFGDVDVETVLLENGALEECPDRDDLCLTPAFEADWRARIDAFASMKPTIEQLIERGELGGSLDRSDVDFAEHGDAYVAAVDGTRIAQWESKAAYLSDVAAAAALRDRYPGWRALSFRDRTEVAASLRLWLDRCPVCDGPVEMGQETVSSCCRERRVLASSCRDCDRRLFEADVAPELLAAD